MAYKCRICGSNTVEHDGDVCELCAIGNDPYMNALHGGQQSGGNAGYGSGSFGQSGTSQGGSSYGKGKRKILLGGGASTTKTDPYGNSIVPVDDNTDMTPSGVHVYGAGQTPMTQQGGSSALSNQTGGMTGGGNQAQKAKGSKGLVSEGISKNITVDHQERSTFDKLMRTMFQGVPYPLDDDVTMFQVFPDYTGTALNALGNACDQVIVYGKVNAGAIAENNDVEVYGHRDKHNNVIATKIVNRASGTSIVPDRVIPYGAIWGMVIAVLALVMLTASALGANGIVWIIVLVLCLTNLPLIIKIIGVIFGIFFSFLKKLF